MKSLNAKRIAAVAASLLVGLALAGSVSFSNIPIINSAGQPVVQIVVGSQAKPSDGVVAANIAAVIGNLAYTSTPVTATVNGAGALSCSVTTPTCTLTNKQVYLGVRGLVAPTGSYEISALIGSVLNGGVFSTGNLVNTKSLDSTGTYSFAKTGTGPYSIPSTSTPSPYEGVNNYIPITAVTPSQNGGGVSFPSFTTYNTINNNYLDNLVGITNAYVSGLMSASGPYSATEELFISGFPVYDQAINNFALLDANGAYQITFGSPVPMIKNKAINHAQITFLGENWTIYSYSVSSLTSYPDSSHFVVGGKLQLAQSMTPLTTVFVGQNLTSGPFTVRLLDLSYPNSSGVSSADVAIYKNGIMYNQTALKPYTTTEFNVSGTPIYLYIDQTFPGLYASQKWAKMQLFSNIINLTNGYQFNSANPTWNVALRWTSNQSSSSTVGSFSNNAELEGIIIYGNTTTGKYSNYMTLTPGQSMTFITDPAVWKVTFAGDSLGTPSAGNSNYDALTFSTSSSQSFTYENLGASQSPAAPYQWNGVAFNALSSSGIPAGNVTAITEPANLFTVTSSIPTAFTIPGKSTSTSTLLYNLDTYELVQKATVKVANTVGISPSTAGVNVILYNHGVSSYYGNSLATAGTPLIVTISGYDANGAPASTQVQFTKFLPTKGDYVSATSSQLFSNITNIQISYPFPYPGVNVIVFDSANTATAALSDTTNNVPMAVLEYVGPSLTYTAPGVSYNKISSSSSSSLPVPITASYSGESGFSTQMTLAQLTPTATSGPTAYFNFYFPEYDLPASQALSSNILLQLTNASTTTPPSVGSALYYLNYTQTPLDVSGAISYTSSQPGSSPVKAPAGFRTERGSMVASITPTQVTYDMAKSVDMLQFIVGPANTTISTAEQVRGPFAVGAQALPNVTIADVTANCTFSTTSCTVNGVSNLTATPSVSQAITPVKLNTAATPLAVLDTNANQASTLIVIGSKYVNSIAAQIFAQNPSLDSSFGPGSVIVQAFGTNRILVAGYTANETVQAGNEFIQDLLTAAGQ
ncbi:MAG: S-layer protein [Candidatus Micrarchaeota archaeon]